MKSRGVIKRKSGVITAGDVSATADHSGEKPSSTATFSRGTMIEMLDPVLRAILSNHLQSAQLAGDILVFEFEIRLPVTYNFFVINFSISGWACV